jgi:solute carrier family 30 (zinc transporter), member 2
MKTMIGSDTNSLSVPLIEESSKNKNHKHLDINKHYHKHDDHDHKHDDHDHKHDDHDHKHDDHDHKHDDHDHKHDDHDHKHDDHDHKHDDHDHKHDDHDHKHDDHDHKHDDHDHKHDDHDHKHTHAHKPKHDDHDHKHTHKPKHNHNHDHKKKHDHKHDHQHNHDHDHQHDENEHEHDHDHSHDHDDSENLNIRSAMIHVIGDLLQSVGVIIAAICIRIWKEAEIVDSICTFVFCFIILCTTIPLLIDCVKLLMESLPNGINIDKIEEALLKIDNVTEVHDLHIWALNSSNYSLTVHLKSTKPMHSLKRATRLLNTKFKILHTTIQVEEVEDDRRPYNCEIYH